MAAADPNARPVAEPGDQLMEVPSYPDLSSLYFEDHDRIKHLWHNWRDPSLGPDEKKELINQLIRELTVQVAAENEVLDPVLRERLGGTLADHMVSELASLKLVMMDLQAMQDPGQQAAVEGKMAQLMEILMGHIHVQEHKGLHNLRKLMTTQSMQDLGRAYQEAKTKAPTNPAELEGLGELQGMSDDDGASAGEEEGYGEPGQALPAAREGQVAA